LARQQLAALAASTGAPGACHDRSKPARTLLMDLERGQWDPELCDASGCRRPPAGAAPLPRRFRATLRSCLSRFVCDPGHARRSTVPPWVRTACSRVKPMHLLAPRLSGDQPGASHRAQRRGLLSTYGLVRRPTARTYCLEGRRAHAGPPSSGCVDGLADESPPRSMRWRQQLPPERPDAGTGLHRLGNAHWDPTPRPADRITRDTAAAPSPGPPRDIALAVAPWWSLAREAWELRMKGAGHRWRRAAPMGCCRPQGQLRWRCAARDLERPAGAWPCSPPFRNAGLVPGLEGLGDHPRTSRQPLSNQPQRRRPQRWLKRWRDGGASQFAWYAQNPEERPEPPDAPPAENPCPMPTECFSGPHSGPSTRPDPEPWPDRTKVFDLLVIRRRRHRRTIALEGPCAAAFGGAWWRGK